jgi:hypothetical protein
VRRHDGQAYAPVSEPRRQRGGDERQQVVDPGHRCNYSQVPHLVLDDAATGALHPASVLLLLHYMRAAFERHGQPINETLRETGKRTGLSNGTLLKARAELVKGKYVTVEKQGSFSGQDVTITLAERWEDNCERHGHLGQKMTKTENLGQKPAKFGQKPAKVGRKLTKSHLNGELLKTLEDIEDSPTVAGVVDDDTRVASFERQLPGMLTEVPPTRRAAETSETYTADELLEGLYRDGLHSKPVRDARELVCARDLAADGATPADAAAWARDAVAEGRLQIVSAATFLKAWPGWRARRRRQGALANRSTGYEHDPWHDRRPPIAEADLARGAAL